MLYSPNRKRKKETRTKTREMKSKKRRFGWHFGIGIFLIQMAFFVYPVGVTDDAVIDVLIAVTLLLAGIILCYPNK